MGTPAVMNDRIDLLQMKKTALSVPVATLLFLSFSMPALADNQHVKTTEFHSWFRPGATAVVDLELPPDEEAKVVRVEVVWSDRRKQTEGQLYVDDHPFDFPREVSQTPATEQWDNINILGRTVQLKILLQTQNNNSTEDEVERRRRWHGVRIETVTVHYEFPVSQ